MAWKLKKEWEGKSIDTINIPLNDLTQKQIEGLNESVRESLFVKEQPKRKRRMWQLKSEYEGKILLPDLTEENVAVMEECLLSVLEKYCEKI